jgi:hypothetical protein
MSNLLRKASMLTGMVIASGSMMLAAAPSYAGNEIEVQALGDVIPACDILAQTVGRLVETVPGDGTTGFTRGRLISAPADTRSNPAVSPFAGGRGELAIVGLSCNQGGDTIATITSPVQISGPTLDINVASTRAYVNTAATDADGLFNTVLTGPYDAEDFTQLPLMAVTSEVGGAVKVSDAALLTGTDANNPSAVGAEFIALGIGFEVEVNGSRIPSGQFGFATTLSVVPR